MKYHSRFLTNISRLLVVSRDKQECRDFQAKLRQLGFTTVDFAHCEQVALAHINSNPAYKLVFVDWDQMPELLNRVRENPDKRHLPFLIAIGMWQRKFLEIIREDGAALYYTRPLQVHSLHERMEKVLSDATRLKIATLKGNPSDTAPASANISELWQILRVWPASDADRNQDHFG